MELVGKGEGEERDEVEWLHRTERRASGARSVSSSAPAVGEGRRRGGSGRRLTGEKPVREKLVGGDGRLRTVTSRRRFVASRASSFSRLCLASRQPGDRVRSSGGRGDTRLDLTVWAGSGMKPPWFFCSASGLE